MYYAFCYVICLMLYALTFCATLQILFLTIQRSEGYGTLEFIRQCPMLWQIIFIHLNKKLCSFCSGLDLLLIFSNTKKAAFFIEGSATENIYKWKQNVYFYWSNKDPLLLSKRKKCEVWGYFLHFDKLECIFLILVTNTSLELLETIMKIKWSVILSLRDTQFWNFIIFSSLSFLMHTFCVLSWNGIGIMVGDLVLLYEFCILLFSLSMYVIYPYY